MSKPMIIESASGAQGLPLVFDKKVKMNREGVACTDWWVSWDKLSTMLEPWWEITKEKSEERPKTPTFPELNSEVHTIITNKEYLRLVDKAKTVDYYKTEVNKLEEEIERLRALRTERKEEYKKHLAELVETNRELFEEVKKLRAYNEGLMSTNKRLNRRLSDLKANPPVKATTVSVAKGASTADEEITLKPHIADKALRVPLTKDEFNLLSRGLDWLIESTKGKRP